MIRAAIYARVSSLAQRESHTIDSQLKVLRAFVAQQRWRLAGEYIDDGKSAKAGKLDKRDGFARLLRDARSNAFDVLAVIDIDRLTRTDDMQERATILGPFQAAGIRIVTPNGGELDLRTMLGEMYVTMQALFAAEENKKRAERTRRGQEHRAQQGGKPRGRTPYGLTYNVEARAWSLHPEQSKRVREIYSRICKGESCLSIAYDFNARGVPAPVEMWHDWLIRRIIISRHTVGEWITDKGKRIVVRVPAAIDEATWQRAQSILINNRLRGLRRTKHFQLLESIATCGLCGRSIVIHRARSGSYYCKGRRRHQPGERICTAKPVSCGDIDARIWATVVHEIESPARARRLAERDRARGAAPKTDAAKLRADIARLTKAEQSLLERFGRGAISEDALDGALANMRKERAAIEETLRAAERAEQSIAAAPSSEQWLFAMRRLAHSGSPQDRQRLVRAVVKSAVLVGDRVRLTMRLGGGLVEHSCPSTHNVATLTIRAVA